MSNQFIGYVIEYIRHLANQLRDWSFEHSRDANYATHTLARHAQFLEDMTKIKSYGWKKFLTIANIIHDTILEWALKFNKSTTSFLKKKNKTKQNKKSDKCKLKQNTRKNNKKKLFQKCTNLIEMLNLITRPIFSTIIIHNSRQKKEKYGLLNCFVDLKWRDYCPKALPITMLRISTCIACLMYKFKLNIAKRLSHLWRFVIDDQIWKYWIWLSKIECTPIAKHIQY